MKPVSRRPEWLLRGVVLLTMAAVAWFYLWTVQSAAAKLELTGQKQDYYNLLVDGFLDGHLYMKADPDPRLLALPPEQRPGNAPFMLDASLYEGRYYLYFGVTPVMVLTLPYAILTGHDFPEALAAVVFMLAGFGAATAWWWEVRRRYFPRLNGVWLVLGVIALGLCTAVPSALRRPMFYEAAIGAGYAFSMLALWALARAWWRPGKSRWWWLALAGVAVGLAVGSRANLAPAGLLGLVVAAAGIAWRGAPGAGRARLFLVGLLAAGGGAAGVGLGLAGYNYARFGSLAEFGHTHQIGLKPQRMFRPENLSFNAVQYYLKPPVLNGYFPFVSPADDAAKPPDYIGREQSHGEWPWTLVVILAAVSAIAAHERRRPEGAPAWWAIVAVPSLFFGINFVVVALTGVRANRYMIDFHPALVLMTLVGLAAGLATAGFWRRSIGVGVAVLVPVAVVFNVLGSLQVHGFFQATAPASYDRIAARADGLVWPWLKGEAAAVGDQEVVLRWPTGNRGWRREPLLAAGPKDFRDVLFVDYDGEGRVRWVFLHGDFSEVAGEWFAYTPGAEVRVRVSGALLLPAVTHPWYGARDPEERLALKRRLRVSVAGQVQFERDVVSYASSPRLQTWGEWRRSDGRPFAFSGEIRAVATRPLAERATDLRRVQVGPVRLRLNLPQDRMGAVEPIFQQSGPQGFDALAVEYARPGWVRLLHDQTIGGGRWSEAFPVDYTQPQWVEITVPVAADAAVWAAVDTAAERVPAGALSVRWNGREVFRPDLPMLPATPLSIALGVNERNSSAAGAFFGGRLAESPRLEALAPRRAGELVGVAAAGAWAEPRGVWLQLDGVDGKPSALVWQREPSTGRVRLGWIEAERCRWLAELAPEEVAGFTARLRLGADASAKEPGVGWWELETSAGRVWAIKTALTAAGVKQAWALAPERWQGAALGGPAVAAGPTAGQLPGKVQLRVVLPAGGLVGGDPLLSAGPAGKADSVFLKGLGGDRYVVGVDHWGYGSLESKPVTLAPEEVHTVIMELGSLATDGVAPKDRARLWVNGAVVLDAAQALYAVKPDEIFYGENPHGMSTSGVTFRGGVVSVRPAVK